VQVVNIFREHDSFGDIGCKRIPAHSDWQRCPESTVASRKRRDRCWRQSTCLNSSHRVPVSCALVPPQPLPDTLLITGYRGEGRNQASWYGAIFAGDTHCRAS